MTKNIFWCSCKVTEILVRFECNMNFLDRSSINTLISNFMKTGPVRTQLFLVDGQTIDINFSKAHKNIFDGI
jgi:hypothetical protein